MENTSDSFMLIGITRPYFYEGEADEIVALLDSGSLTYVHVRKPGADDAAVEALVRQVPTGLRSRLTVHYHFAVAQRLGLGGIHLSGSCPVPPADWRGRVSRSCHRILWRQGSPMAQTVQPDDGTPWAVGDGFVTDYDFLSPIYDSISKEGYRSSFSPSVLAEAARSGLIGRRTVALGGVTMERIGELRRLGFGGAAMLGALWRG